MTVRVQAVDGKNKAIAGLLQYLQLTILPSDEPLPTDVGYWWIAYEGELAVAFASLKRTIQWSDAGYLSRSGVLISHRGQGLQKRLLQVRQRKAKSLGWKWLVTDTLLNPPSANSLISRGFRMFDPTNPWGIEATTYWRKEI
jgi:hypothetical protein